MFFHSLKFDIQSSSLDIPGVPARLYRSNDLSQSLADNVASLVVEVERRLSGLAIEPIGPGTGVFAETNLLGGMCWFVNGRFYSACDGEFKSEAEFIPADGRLRVNVGGKYDHTDDEGVVALVVKQIMQSFVLPFYRLKFLHGAVVSRDGSALMLTGRGGAGKSTTALKLFEQGYTLLSDDGPLFTRHGGKTWALSSLDCSQATANTLDLMPALKTGVLGKPDHRGKYRIRTDLIRSDECWKKPHRVTHLVDLDRRECARPSIVKADLHDVIASTVGDATTVFRSSVFGTSPRFREHSRFAFDVITGLADGTSAWRLQFADRHLHDLPALLADLK